MSPCKFVRKNTRGYEYGYVTINDVGSKNEKRDYIVVGETPDYVEALSKNTMALEGKKQVGFKPDTSFSWKEL